VLPLDVVKSTARRWPLRKLIVTGVAIAAGVGLALAGRLDYEAVSLLVGCVLAFSGGNAAEHLGSLRGPRT
jgi:hypothetical protein